MNSMPMRKGEAASFLGEEMAKLELMIEFLQGELRKQCKQKMVTMDKLKRQQKTSERQKATIDKLKKQLKAYKAIPAAKSMKAK